MRFGRTTQGIPLLILGACSPSFNQNGGETGLDAQIPEAVMQIAAPYQDLTTARLRPEDNCYWYLHEGPVETTLLPLRTLDGRPICVASEVGTAG